MNPILLYGVAGAIVGAAFGAIQQFAFRRSDQDAGAAAATVAAADPALNNSNDDVANAVLEKAINEESARETQYPPASDGKKEVRFADQQQQTLALTAA